MRSLSELIDCKEPGSDILDAWAREASNQAEVLTCEPECGAATLLALQVTTRSLLGTVAFSTGGILIDHRWLRILGAGSVTLSRSLVSWNRMGGAREQMRLPGAILVGDDVGGGFFAMDGGGIRAPSGNVCYLPPDTAEWEDTGRGYTDWLRWAFVGDLALFYRDERRPGWESDVRTLPVDMALPCYPPRAGGLATEPRVPLPIEQVWDLRTSNSVRQ